MVHSASPLAPPMTSCALLTVAIGALLDFVGGTKAGGNKEVHCIADRLNMSTWVLSLGMGVVWLCKLAGRPS